MDGEKRLQTRAAFARMPLQFEPNQGQIDSSVKFLSRAGGYNFFLTSREAILTLNQPPRAPKSRTHLERRKPNHRDARHSSNTAANNSKDSLRLQLIDANLNAEIIGEDEQAGKSNHFIGSDPTAWRTDVPTFNKLRRRSVYAGVDQIFYDNQSRLEYDFIVAPGVDYRPIKMKFAGAKSVRLDNANGELVIKTARGAEVRQHKPLVYQEVNGKRTEIEARYVLSGKGAQTIVSFDVGSYDKTLPLTIDPTLVYSTYLGGSGAEIYVEDTGKITVEGAITVDAAGSAYFVGLTSSLDFPTQNPFQKSNAGGTDAFTTRLNASGNGIVYSTYLGGGGDDEANHDRDVTILIAVDAGGNAYVLGTTHSPDFPLTPNAFQKTLAPGGNVFMTKLNSNGTGLIYSTFLAGQNQANGYYSDPTAIVLDQNNNAYVTGVTNDPTFPTTKGSYQTTFQQDAQFSTVCAFVTKLNASGSGLIYSTFLGVDGYNAPFGITLDANNNAYVAGYTTSHHFPVTSDAFQTSFAVATAEGFVTKLNAEAKEHFDATNSFAAGVNFCRIALR